MNDVIRNILSRRSIRKYKPEQFPEEALNLILEAGLSAPTSRNSQARNFCVVRGQSAIDRITREVKEATARDPGSRYTASVGRAEYTVNYHAPTFVIVSADPAVTASPGEDCALALENMFLAAHSLGIGSCWINQLNPLCGDPAFRAFLTALGVPATHRVYGCAALGYPEGAHPEAHPRKEGQITHAK